MRPLYRRMANLSEGFFTPDPASGSTLAPCPSPRFLVGGLSVNGTGFATLRTSALAAKWPRLAIVQYSPALTSKHQGRQCRLNRNSPPGREGEKRHNFSLLKWIRNQRSGLGKARYGCPGGEGNPGFRRRGTRDNQGGLSRLIRHMTSGLLFFMAFERNFAGTSLSGSGECRLKKSGQREKMFCF